MVGAEMLDRYYGKRDILHFAECLPQFTYNTWFEKTRWEVDNYI
jgi:hypothetical protein